MMKLNIQSINCFLPISDQTKCPTTHFMISTNQSNSPFNYHIHQKYKLRNFHIKQRKTIKKKYGVK